MDPLLRLIIIVVQSYVIGSIPTALFVSKNFFGFDVRERGSGNMGSTNVFRTMGWKAGIAVQIADILKGFIAVSVVAIFFETQMPFQNRTPFQDQTVVMLIAGLAVTIGHIYSMFAGFRGGKGMNTSLGVLLAVAPVELAVALGVFLLFLTSSGYVSLGSIAAAMSVPSTMAFRYNILGVNIEGYTTLVYFCILLALLVIYAHRSNVQRLLAGTENRAQRVWLFRKKL
jgi:acyl phosphate:glycerol-3-phosphate acyltransferase